MRQTCFLPTARSFMATEIQRNPHRDASVRPPIRRRSKLISENASLDFVPPRSKDTFGGKTAPPRRQPRGGRRHGRRRADRRPLGEVRGDTVHFDIIDTAGNMISREPSALAAIVAGDSGTRLLPRQPRADVLARRESPRSTRHRASPAHHAQSSMALRDGEPYLPWGSPAAISRIMDTQFFLRHVHPR